MTNTRAKKAEGRKATGPKLPAQCSRISAGLWCFMVEFRKSHRAACSIFILTLCEPVRQVADRVSDPARLRGRPPPNRTSDCPPHGFGTAGILLPRVEAPMPTIPEPPRSGAGPGTSDGGGPSAAGHLAFKARSRAERPPISSARGRPVGGARPRRARPSRPGGRGRRHRRARDRRRAPGSG
jgi:hypothetical protein